MLRTGLEKVLSQLDGIVEALEIPEFDRGYTHIADKGYPSFNIRVDIGEINMGTAYMLIFDMKGNLLECWHEWWQCDGHIARERKVLEEKS
jgi:hypothetical protein